MLAYQIRLALKSLRRNPMLSLLMIGGIGLGIAVSMTFVTAYFTVSGDPIPSKSDRLYYVQIDAWNPDRPYDEDEPDEAPDQLTYLDAMAIRTSDIPTYQSAMYKTYLTIHPGEIGADSGMRPFRQTSRMCFADFFPMFEVPFRYGGPWSAESDAGPEQVIVLGDELNDRLFGGENSVGRTVRIEDREFEVVGVLGPWNPVPKFYDPLNGEFDSAEQLFMPFHIGNEMQIRTNGNTSGWGGDTSTWELLLQSESIWIQYWVQLDDRRQRDEYMAFLDAYALEQQGLGRHGRDPNNKLKDVMAWLHYRQVVPDEAVALLINSLLFLLICSVNMIGILLGKFLARAPEVGVRRALGASRRWVFVQHLIESELIGVIGCVLGLFLTVFGLRLLDRIYGAALNVKLDLNMLGIALVLALASALIAGIYPAWRVCRIQPGLHLKAQ